MSPDTHGARLSISLPVGVDMPQIDLPPIDLLFLIASHAYLLYGSVEAASRSIYTPSEVGDEKSQKYKMCEGVMREAIKWGRASSSWLRR